MTRVTLVRACDNYMHSMQIEVQRRYREMLARYTRSLSDARKRDNQYTCETHVRKRTSPPFSHMTCSRDDL